MPRSLCWLVCQYYRAEVAAVIQQEGWPDVQLQTYASLCQHPLAPTGEGASVLPTPGAECGQTCLLSGCLPARALSANQTGWRSLALQQCFHLLAAPEWVDRLLLDGNYLVTPGWLSHWPQHLADWGFDQPTARAFFQESARQVVLLDSGLDPDNPTQAQALGDYVGLPVQTWPVGLSYLRANLRALYLEWQAAQARADADRQAADYLLAFDWLPRLAVLQTEADVAEELASFCALLFAPHQACYVPVSEGQAGPAYDGLVPITPPVEYQAWLSTDTPYAWTPDGQGFWLRLTYLTETLGTLEIDRLAFPAYREHYLALALALAPVGGLAIANARAYQSLHQLNAELEERVAVRTAELSARTVELSQANEALTRALRVKSEFLAAMSHELRTPLAGILGLTETLQLGIYDPPTERQQKPLALVQANGQRLLALVTDVLDYTALEAGPQLQLVNVPVTEVCQASVQAVQAAAESRQIRLTCQVDSLVDTVPADRQRLEEMLVKLLENAIKFTPEGGAAGLEVNGDAQGRAVYFTIWDTGIGIASEDQARILEPFVQADSRLARNYEGAGLGLALVRRLAELHGGRLTVESEGLPGKGSRFILALPWQVMEPSQIPTQR